MKKNTTLLASIAIVLSSISFGSIAQQKQSAADFEYESMYSRTYGFNSRVPICKAVNPPEIDFNCNGATCNKIITTTFDAKSSCSSGFNNKVNHMRHNKVSDIKFTNTDKNNAQEESSLYNHTFPQRDIYPSRTLISAPAKLDHFYQLLTYLPVVDETPSAYEDAKKLKANLDKMSLELVEFQTARLNQVFNSIKISGISANDYIYGIKEQNAMLDKRRKVIDFMLASPDSFKNFKTAFNKYYTYTPYELPKLNQNALTGKKLNSYDCQFMKLLERESTLTSLEVKC